LTKPEPEPSALDILRAVVFSCVGIAIVAGGAYEAVWTHAFARSSERVPGIVTRLAFGPAHPEIRFETRAGRVVVYDQGGLIFAHVGERVDVRYARDDPRRSAVVDGFATLYGDDIAFTAMGVVFIVAGGSTLASLARRRSR
jgi:hypothetical protein